MSPRFFIVMKTVIQIGIRNWVLYDRAEMTYRRIFKNIGQSDPVKVNEYLSHFWSANKILDFRWNKRVEMFSYEDRIKEAKLYIESGFDESVVV